MAIQRRYGFFAGVAVAAIMVGFPAAAQKAGATASANSSPPSQSAAGSEGGQSSEIIVTAEKRSEVVQSVPLAISAVSSSKLERTGTHSFEDLLTLAPSVSFISYGPAAGVPAIRGVGGVAGGGWSPTTGFYLDEIPLSASFTSGGTDLTFLDINHVEILRGPQGTLYGAGAMGGAVRIITNDPNLSRFGGDIDLTGGSVAGRAAEFDGTGVLNIPLVDDQLALRVAANYNNVGNYVYDPLKKRDDAGGSTSQAFRAKLKWQPNDNFTAELTGVYGKTYSANTAVIGVLPNNVPQYGNLAQVTYSSNAQEAITKLANLTMSYKFPFATLVSSSSYINATQSVLFDDTLGLGAEIPAALGLPPEAYQFSAPGKTNSYIEELRLVSASTHPFKWVVGFYFDHDHLDLDRLDYFDANQPLSSIVPINYILTTSRTFYSGFGEATYDFTDQWHLTVGARYTDVPDTSFTKVYGLVFGAAHLTPATGAAATGSSTSTDFSPKFELTYTPTHDLLFYAEAARGFRPGAANVAIPTSIATVPSEQGPDHLWDYEVGAKTQWFDGHLVVNGDLYYIDWEDIQIIAAAPATTKTQIIFPYFGNAGAATVKGAELEVQAVLSPEWSFGLSGAYTDARFSENTPAEDIVVGERIAYVPEWSGSITADYRRPLSDAMTFFAHADVRYNGDETTGYSPIEQGFHTKAYTLVGMNVGLELPHQTRFTVFVHNLTDDRGELYVTNQGVCASATSCGVINANKAAQFNVLIDQPRTVGVEVSKKF
jgi:outer membrane receptor protein involved in Fe transport